MKTIAFWRPFFGSLVLGWPNIIRASNGLIQFVIYIYILFLIVVLINYSNFLMLEIIFFLFGLCPK